MLELLKDTYKDRNPKRIDEIMSLLYSDKNIEMIGIGAYERNGEEWFKGKERIREIILGDWEYWGDVDINAKDSQITVNENTAWVSMTAQLLKSKEFESAMFDYVKQMKLKLDGVDSNVKSPISAVLDAVYFGLGRLRDNNKKIGEGWPLVITAVLVKRENIWKFHTLHWSMPPEP